MFKKSQIALIVLLLFLPSANAAGQHENKIKTSGEYIVDLQQNDNRIFLQPNGPFAVIAFNEYALAIHIGVVYFEQMGNPVDEKWNISERFWQSSKWGADVTSIAWGPDGKYLYVATAMVYGEGAIFKLNLKEKTYGKIFPKNKDKFEYLRILGFDKQNKKLKVETSFQDRNSVIYVSLD